MIKRFFGILLLVSAWQTSWAFSPAGPIGNGGDAWQVPTIGYGLGGDLNAPKNFGEEFRRNTPLMYYAFDANFYEYFGPEGATGVGNAFGILNALTNVDNFSKTLVEFPLESRSKNYQAKALKLMDLKSQTLGLLMEQMGAADPIRYAWTLHDRYQIPGTTCPDGMEYLVVQRNFDFSNSSLTQMPFSPYVNNVLYSYEILEWCKTDDSLFPPALALAYPSSADPLADTYSPVASFSLSYGDYYTGLTRDDAALLRYLLTTNNVNWETPSADSLLVITNTSIQELFPVYGSGGTNATAGGTTSASSGGWYNAADGVTYGTYSYPALLAFAQNNNPTALQAAYPGLQFNVISNYYAWVTITNTISYYTNFYGGFGPSLVIKKQKQPALQQFFVYQFLNIVTNLYSKTTQAKIQTLTVSPVIGAPVGSPSVTNVSTKKVTLKIPNGDFYIIPTGTNGTFCGLDIIAAFPYTNYWTNVITSTSSTNTAVAGGSTNNASGATNFSGYAYSQIQVIQSVGHIYVTHPVTCGATTNATTGLLRGIGRVNYLRADYDSLLGQLWQPVTNDYQMVLITNSRASTMSFRRVVTAPDFLFTAMDMAAGPAGVPTVPFGTRSLTFNEDNVLPGLAGPGTITAPTVFTYNKASPVYFNSSSGVMNGTPYFTSTPGSDTNSFYLEYFLWANFDGTTNAPIVFPNGTSLENLQNLIIAQVSPRPGELADGYAGVPYTPVTFTAIAGAFTQPFTWQADALPEGMTLSTGGTLSGTPVLAGTYDFTLTLTDAVGRSVSWDFSLKIKTTILSSN